MAPNNRTQSGEKVSKQLENFVTCFDQIKPFEGEVEKDFLVDCFGILTSLEFRRMWHEENYSIPAGNHQTRLPVISDGEGWFEAVNWIEAAKAAKGSFVMITLGACYGAQAVGAARVLEMINPMPFKLVAVEGDPENVEWVKQHMSDNNIDPEKQWIIEAAVSNNNDPVLFPTGAPGTGTANCFSTDEKASREAFYNYLVEQGQTDHALHSILTTNSTGIRKDMAPGSEYEFEGEVKYVSSITLESVLGPFDFVDFIESDIQQSEIVVFPPAMDVLKKKVRRIHIGTHGLDVHNSLRDNFYDNGWEIVFDYEPNAHFETEFGNFSTNDGVLSVVNKDL